MIEEEINKLVHESLIFMASFNASSYKTLHCYISIDALKSPKSLYFIYETSLHSSAMQKDIRKNQ